MARNVRDYRAPELVKYFPKIIQGAHIIGPRDARYIADFMLREAFDAIDVLWAMNEYRGVGLKDIPSFIRWASRNDPTAEVSYARRELEVAQLLGVTRAPYEALAYFDLEDECYTAQDHAAQARAEQALRRFVDPVLGARPNEAD